MVVNLLSNAARYTPRVGRIELAVASEQDEAILTVRDTGVGLDEATIARIFDMFYQGDAARDEDRRRTAAAGFDRHLTKPADFAALRALLRERPSLDAAMPR